MSTALKTSRPMKRRMDNKISTYLFLSNIYFWPDKAKHTSTTRRRVHYDHVLICPPFRLTNFSLGYNDTDFYKILDLFSVSEENVTQPIKPPLHLLRLPHPRTGANVYKLYRV